MATDNQRLTKVEEGVNKLLKLAAPETSSELKDDTDYEKFAARRQIFALVGLFLSALQAYLMFIFFLPLFSVSFGIFLTFGMLGMILLFNKYVIPGHTILRISNNAIASAIFILCIALVIIFGAQIGNSVITDPYGNGEDMHNRQPVVSEQAAPESAPESASLSRLSGTTEPRNNGDSER